MHVFVNCCLLPIANEAGCEAAQNYDVTFCMDCKLICCNDLVSIREI